MKKAFLKGCLIVLLGVFVLVGGYSGFHWFSSVDENDFEALAQQAKDYFGYNELFIEEVEQKGDYLAALCTDDSGKWCMCVFERDSRFFLPAR